MKKKLFLIIILAVFLAITSSANAAQIKSSQLYSEYRTYSTTFTYDDQYFMQAFAYVDVNKTVYLQGVPGSTGDEPLIYIPGWSNPPTSYEYDKYFTTVDDYPSPGPVWEDRNYNFYIEGNLDNKSYYIPSGSISQMGVPSSVTISGGFNPTITWNAVDGAEFYRVRFFQIGDNGNPDRSLFWVDQERFSIQTLQPILINIPAIFLKYMEPSLLPWKQTMLVMAASGLTDQYIIRSIIRPQKRLSCPGYRCCLMIDR